MIPEKEEWQKNLEQRHGVGFQRRISATSVAICGLGGLGTNIATALARAGIGKLILVDFDKVDITNLHRQQYKVSQIGMYKTEAMAENLKEIAPYVEVERHCVRITEENFEELLNGAEFICEAFDGAEAKAMLTNCVLEKMPEKYIIAASGMAGMEDANFIRTRKITKHFYVCGDEISDVDDGMCLVSSRAMLCAAHQAHAVLQIIYKMGN